jgi:dihydrofolate reductase
MQKNIVFIGRSLDGYIAGKNGELDWLDSIPNPEHNDMGYHQLMDEIEAIVMGRTTFETVCGFGGEWPFSKPVFVLSHTLRVVPEALNDRVTLLKGSPQEVLAQIHALGYFKLYIDGGKTIQHFLQEDLIDELRITTIPILLGGGFPLFGELSQPMEFEHLESKLFLGQIVQNCYKRKRK